MSRNGAPDSHGEDSARFGVFQSRGNYPSLVGEHSPSIVQFPRAGKQVGLGHETAGRQITKIMSAKALSGKAALVTGGSRGVGAAVARRLSAARAAGAITYSSGP